MAPAVPPKGTKILVQVGGLRPAEGYFERTGRCSLQVGQPDSIMGVGKGFFIGEDEMIEGCPEHLSKGENYNDL